MKHNKAVAVCASNNSYAISISWGYPSVYGSMPFTWDLPKIKTCCSKNLVTEIGMLLRAWDTALAWTSHWLLVSAEAEKMTCKVGKMSSGQNLPIFDVLIMFFKVRALKTNTSTGEGTCRALSVCWSRHQILLICLQFSVTSLCKLSGLQTCLGYQNTCLFLIFSISSVWKLGCET